MKRNLLGIFLSSVIAAFAPGQASATPVVVYNVIKASQIAGVVLDCVVNPNLANVGKTASGGACTDNTAAINGAIQSLATNGVGSIKLILDGGTATTGIVLPSVAYFEIEGIGRNSGIWINSGSNADPLNNGAYPFTPVGTAPAQTGTVIIHNFTINGNRGNGTTGDSTSGNPRGINGTYWYCNITLYGLNGVRIEDMYLYDSPAYSIRLVNCSHVWVQRNNIYNPNVTATLNQDGVHLDGPMDDVHVNFNYINNNNSDDGIAVNPPEGYSGGNNIDHVEIMGNVLESVLHGVRLYGLIDGNLGSAIVSGNQIVAQTAGFWIGNLSGTGDASGRVLIFDHNSVQLTASGSVFALTSNVGDIRISNTVWRSPTASGNFLGGQGGSVSSIEVVNSGIYRSTEGNNTSSNLLAATAATTIGRLTVNGFNVVNQAGQSYSAIANLIAMTNLTISNLNVQALDYTNITAFADSYTNITNLSGSYANKQFIAANKTGAYTVVPTDAYMRGDATTATFAFTLPAAPYLYEEHDFIKVDSSANAITIAGNGKTINGNASLGSQWAHAKMRYNGSSWDSL